MSDQKKILIVEDEVLSAMFLESKLKRYGFDIIKPVTNGIDAVKSALENHPDIILMDVRLSGSMDGIQAAEKIFLDYSPKIIFMTGYRGEEILSRINKKENVLILEKPLKITELLQFISAE